ncbi:MAG: Fe-S protein assembly co-chaperone HscB [Deltaproteobacteria bacterium]|nr:Fe-S protein assembly co-chaperone HscB [Nannocystaceae bacterium]
MNDSDHFATLGLEPSYDIERTELERSYLALQQLHHPDRAVGGSVGEQRAALERSAAINEAYRVLRDPVRRAEYLCKRSGIDLDSSDAVRGAPKMDQSFLLEMIEQREALQAADTQARRDAFREGVDTQLDQTLDAAVSELRRGAIPAAARALVRRRYLQRLLDEIDGAAA